MRPHSFELSGKVSPLFWYLWSAGISLNIRTVDKWHCGSYHDRSCYSNYYRRGSYEATATQKGIQQGGRHTMAQRIFRLFMELPGLMRLGVLILAFGGTLDVLYHAAP